MSNSNFGKQIENARKYKDTRIANNDDKAKKIATKVTLMNGIYYQKILLNMI